MGKRILITPRSLTRDRPVELQPLSAAGYELVYSPAGVLPTEADLRHLLPACVGYLAGIETITGQVLAMAPHLCVISRNGSGIDNIDIAEAGRRGIHIARTARANARGVAELALALTLSSLRSIPQSHHGVRAQSWSRRIGREVAELTVGVIGCGAIGGLTAELFLALGARVVGHDPVELPTLGARAGFRYVDLAELIHTADVISLHCPAQEQNRPLLNSAAIAEMRPGAHIINTARASLVDEAAVLAGLDSGHLAAYATDVFTEEPPPPGPLLSHDRVIVTPHIGGYTGASVSRATAEAVDNLLKYLRDTEAKG